MASVAFAPTESADEGVLRLIQHTALWHLLLLLLLAACCCCGLQINCITAKNNQLQGRVQALGSDHSSLLSRLVDVTGKWQATVVDNAQLHQENGQLRLQLAQLQQQLALVQQQMQHVLGQAQQLQTHPW